MFAVRSACEAGSRVLQLHLNNTLLLLSHGKHVLVEKPTALTVAEAEQMLQLAKYEMMAKFRITVTSVI
jgi:hypothetical protein